MGTYLLIIAYRILVKRLIKQPLKPPTPWPHIRPTNPQSHCCELWPLCASLYIARTVQCSRRRPFFCRDSCPPKNLPVFRSLLPCKACSNIQVKQKIHLPPIYYEAPQRRNLALTCSKYSLSSSRVVSTHHLDQVVHHSLDQDLGQPSRQSD